MDRNFRRPVTTLLLAAAAGAQAQTFSLEGAVIDSRSSQNLGVISERGDINTLFRAQKAMTFGILRSAGISLEQLPPDIRARIERFQTANIEAFRAFSQGLDLKDQGKFAEAKAQFRRAAELDPGFALAAEQQQSMPDVNLGVNVTTRAVIAAAAGAALDRGKASVAVDTAQAVAALAAGATVVLGTVPNNGSDASKGLDYSVNNTGAGDNFLPRLVAGYAYSRQLDGNTTAMVASAQEWKGNNYRTNGEVLESLGVQTGFLAARRDATNLPGDSVRLGDGSVAYWGAWLSVPGASASVSVAGVSSQAPVLGPLVDYVFGSATTQMPTTGTASYAPAGGSLGAATGTIQVNFAQQLVSLQNLGFNLAGLEFSGLNGSARYATATGVGTPSGGFVGQYSSGSCIGCASGARFAGDFSGSFMGRDASGLAFATNLQTGLAAVPVVSGVHLFTVKP